PRRGRWRERGKRTHLCLSDLFEEGQRRGEIRADVRPRQLAEVFMAVVLVTVSNWLLFPGDESPPDDDADEGPLDEALLQAWVVFRDGTATRPRPARRPSVASAASSRRR